MTPIRVRTLSLALALGAAVLSGCTSDPCPGPDCPPCDGGPVNACGGCTVLVAAPYSLCGPEQRSLNVCAGPDFLACRGAAPTDVTVSASLEDGVRLTWGPPELPALRYVVTQAGRRVPLDDGGLSATDFLAPAGTLGSPRSVTASTQVAQAIEVRWERPNTSLGSAVSYVITTLFDAGAGQPLVSVDFSTETGRRAAPEVVAYEVEREGVAQRVGLDPLFTDTSEVLGAFTSPPQPEVRSFQVRPEVTLTALATFSIEPGRVRYRVRALSDGGASPWSVQVEGFRRVDPDFFNNTRFVWERSLSDTSDGGGPYEALAVPNQANTADRSPVLGERRWYRVRAEYPGVVPTVSDPAEGIAYRPVQVVALPNSTCALRLPDNKRVCWGLNTTAAPAGVSADEFTFLAAGNNVSCGLLLDGRAQCLGFPLPSPNPSDILFRNLAIAASGQRGQDVVCGIATDGGHGCITGTTSPPRADVVSHNARCAVLTDGGLTCFNSTNLSPPNPLPATLGLSPLNDVVCGLTAAGAITCSSGVPTPPGGTFREVAWASSHGCGVRTDGGLSCWGTGAATTAVPVDGPFIGLSTNQSHACALRVDAGVACWGNNGSNQLVVP